MAKERFSDQQAAIIAPIVERLLSMMGAARDAFNRHSRDRLQELQSFQKIVSRNIADASQQVESMIARSPKAEQEVLRRLETVLGGLGTIDANLGSLVDPIHKKIKGGVLFSDKAVTQTNYLFDQHTGMIKSLLDIVKTDNQFLKNYVKSEGRNLVQVCTDFATEHEDRLIEGLCAPQAAPIFLGILEAMRDLGQTEADIVRQLLE